MGPFKKWINKNSSISYFTPKKQFRPQKKSIFSPIKKTHGKKKKKRLTVNWLTILTKKIGIISVNYRK